MMKDNKICPGEFWLSAIASGTGIYGSLVAVSQFILFLVFFVLGGVIIPYTTPAMVSDVKACGGFLILATGFRIIKVKNNAGLKKFP